jgi:hypothetical protein
MYDGRPSLRRHAEWQKERARLSWPEKLRMAEVLNETLRCFRSSRTKQGIDKNSGATEPAAKTGE